MNLIKKSMRMQDKVLLKSYKNKNFLVIILNNFNKQTYNFVYKKLNKMLLDFFITTLKGKVFMNISFNLNNYFFIKNKVSNLLNSESFNFNFFSIKVGKNILDINFFEKNVLINNSIGVINQVYAHVYFNMIYNNIFIKINLFIIISLFFININLFKVMIYNNKFLNVNYSPSSI